ncbi:proteobacterial dedicated sortase system histidine kinase [Colwellia echini]|uniref:histidine kinase n=1 Tax=Colwellia echini TaxID=1982103 RepID=A0ABY3MUC4_9GAMM|nr:proteobacterial dedicated sortase system histidine kinase [Colwellia echini]TYK64795.1 proteobacterial dedicated sortase system histidine kinase [Colwellia echini]
MKRNRDPARSVFPFNLNLTFKPRFGLRSKLFLLSLFLFAIPLLGYQYVWEMEKYLRIGQEKTLMGTVRAVATALHERPTLFDKQASFLPQVQKGRDLYAYPIVDPIQLDGQLDDWRNQQRALNYQQDYLLEGDDFYQPESLSFKHMVGIYQSHLYAYFDVTDDSIVYRPKNSLRIDNNDLLQIAFITPAGDFRRYIIATKAPGWLTAYEIDISSGLTSTLNPAQNSSTTYGGNKPLAPEPRIQGMWSETEQGYTIELRLPLSMLGSQLSFAISDIDNNSSSTQRITIGTSAFAQADQLGTVLLPSPEIERIIKGLDHSESRIWVVDKHGRVLAKAGDIKNSDGLWGKMTQPALADTWYRPLQEQLLAIYNKILTTPPKDFNDQLYDVAQLEGSHLTKALTGESGASWRLTSDNKAVILSAAYPIYSDGEVQGAVIAEETTNGIRSLRNQALQSWFNIIIAVMGLGTFGLFMFASRTSNRIRALRNQTEQAIDEQGKIIQAIPLSKASDEVGDLQRSFALMVQRLGQYTQYLQGMSASLSHELRTPVAVVKSSLESLELDLPASQDNVYMHRAKEGVNRLSTILTLMSEATRLEQSLQNSERIDYSIDEVVRGCVQGYQLTQPQQEFDLVIDLVIDSFDRKEVEKTVNPNLSTSSIDATTKTIKRKNWVNGGPELLAQLLDKLLANAVEFAAENTIIDIRLSRKNDLYILTISNIGELLPEAMQERLFDSMVSVRKNNQSFSTTKHNEMSPQQQPHLGLGLYIAQLIAQFHQGKIEIINNESATGVDAIVTIPTVK